MHQPFVKAVSTITNSLFGPLPECVTGVAVGLGCLTPWTGQGSISPACVHAKKIPTQPMRSYGALLFRFFAIDDHADFFTVARKIDQNPLKPPMAELVDGVDKSPALALRPVQ